MAEKIASSKIPKVHTKLRESGINKNLHKKDEYVEKYSDKIISEIPKRPYTEQVLKVLQEMKTNENE